MTECVRHDILMITHNRTDYTQMALKQLLATCDETMRVWVWHNGDHQPTRDVVKSAASHPRMYRVHYNAENVGIRDATNWFFRESSAAYLSKVDDDCLVPERWGQTLIKAHESNPQLGVISCWHFLDEDYVPELAQPKIVSLEGGHQLMRNCWTPGSGWVMKRECLIDVPGIPEGRVHTNFCIQLALKGWINGFYFPFIRQEHMDDPRSEYTRFRTEEDFQRNPPLSALNDNVQTLEEWKRRVRFMAYGCQSSSPDPRQFVGWRKKLNRAKDRFKRAVGIREPWRL